MATTGTKTHTFRLTLAGVAGIDDAMENAIFEAGCDDGGLGQCEGVVSIDFERDAECLADAVGSAIRDVERAGFAVARVEVGERP